VRIAKLAGGDADPRCQLCLSADGTLDHRRSCPATLMTTEGGCWPSPEPAAAALVGRLDVGRRRLLETRGWFTLNMRIPRQDPVGWFSWIQELPDVDLDGATFYIDGSLIDGQGSACSRTGFAIVVVNADGELIAYAQGAPPGWVRSSPAAEAWALAMALKAVPSPPSIVTDCLGLIDTLARGKRVATAAGRPLARIWNMVFDALDGEVPQDYIHRRFRWMSSHGSMASIGRSCLSDGSLVSATDWRANRLVDAFARLAAMRNRVPKGMRDLLEAAGKAVEHSAAVLGAVTFAANNYQTSELLPDGTYAQARRRDACPPAFENTSGRAARRRGPQTADDAQPQAAHPPPQPSRDQRPTEQPFSAAAFAKGKAGRAREARQERDDAAQARFAESWLADRAAAPSAAPAQASDARSRLEALRRRVADKAAQRDAF